MNIRSKIGGGGGRDGGTPAANPSEETVARHGSIARLLLADRQQFNEFLKDVEAAGSLLRWLKALPETLAMLAASFDGEIINEPVLSTWRQGGFRDWKARQLPLEAMDGAIEPPPNSRPQVGVESQGGSPKIQVNPG